MKQVGIFEAKTKFPGLCDQIVRSGTPVLVQRRGKPLVVVSPADTTIQPGSEGILDGWQAWEKRHPGANDADAEDFPEVWKMRGDKPASPLDE